MFPCIIGGLAEQFGWAGDSERVRADVLCRLPVIGFKSARQRRDTGRAIFVGNLDPSVTKDELSLGLENFMCWKACLKRMTFEAQE